LERPRLFGPGELPIVAVAADPKNIHATKGYKDTLDRKMTTTPFAVIDLEKVASKAPMVAVVLIRAAGLITFHEVKNQWDKLRIKFPDATLVIDRGSNDRIEDEFIKAGIYSTNDQLNLNLQVWNICKRFVPTSDPQFNTGD